MLRTFELLLLISFLPAIVLPFLPANRRPRWLAVLAALLPALLAIIHAVIEGYRVQMFPAYLLALLVLVLQSGILRGNRPPARTRSGMFGAGVLALLVAGTAYFAGVLLGIPTIPAPDGPYAVGITHRLLVDETRDRRIMASVWYPASTAGAPALLTEYPDETAIAVGDFFSLPALLLQHMRFITVQASDDAPLLASDDPFPVIVFSHGLGGLRFQAASLLQQFASHGYVVLAIDHTYTSAVTVMPDGEAIYYDLTHFGLPVDAPSLPGDGYRRALDADVFPVWVADHQFAYDTLENWNAEDDLLAGRLDLTRIGSIGHSFGGATSAEICSIDERCQAAIDMDGRPFGGFTERGPARPFFYLSADPERYGGAQAAIPDMEQALTSSEQPVYWLVLDKSTHYSFTDVQLLSPLMQPEGYDPRAGLEIIYDYTLAFFDTYLRGADEMQRVVSQADAGVIWVIPTP